MAETGTTTVCVFENEWVTVSDVVGCEAPVQIVKFSFEGSDKGDNPVDMTFCVYDHERGKQLEQMIDQVMAIYATACPQNRDINSSVVLLK